MLSGYARFIANKIFKFPRGTNRSSYTQLYAAFLLSALFHFAGDLMIFRGRTVYYAFKFFLLQAIVITFEGFVIYIAKCFLGQRGVELLTPGKPDESWGGAVVRVAGYCWVTIWFCLTLPMRLGEPNAIGFGVRDRGLITQYLLDAWNLDAYVVSLFAWLNK